MIDQIPFHNFTCQQIGELIMVNPNSFDGVKHIFHEFKLIHTIAVDRDLAILRCNGPPFRIASIITQKNPQKYGWAYLVLVSAIFILTS